ncbi:MAG: tetratricopeptide repeat protein [Planctomycetes bacterium]|nr:tetratricopeptide repeat protein [Planctomycetota bacterium]
MRTSCFSIALVLCTGCLQAQEPDDLAAARAKAEARDWHGTIAALTAAIDRLSDAEERNAAAEIAVQAGKAQRAAGDAAGALTAYETALRLRRLVHGEKDHADVAMDLDDIGTSLRSLGRSQEALARHEAAAAMAHRLAAGAADMLVAASENQLGMCLADLRRHDEALPHFQTSFANTRRLVGDQDAPNLALVMGNLAKSLFLLARYEESLRLREELYEMLQRTGGFGIPTAVPRQLLEIVMCLGALGRLPEALAQCELALSLHEEAAGSNDDAGRAEILAAMAQCLELVDRADEAIQRREQALELVRGACADRDDPRLVESLLGSGWSFAAVGRHEDALRCYEEGAAMAQRLAGGRDDERLAKARMGLGSCLAHLGRQREAMVHLAESLAVTRRAIGNRDHPDLARTLSQFAVAVHVAGDCDEACARHEEALAMRWRMLAGRDDRDLAANLTNLGLCLRDLGRFDEALPMFEAAIAMYRRLGGANVRGICSNLSNLALCLRDLGRLPEALHSAEEALRVARTAPGSGANLFRLQHNVALLLGDLDRDDEALAATEAATGAIRQRHAGADHPDLIAAELNLAVRRARVGRVVDALTACESASETASRLFGDSDHPLRPELALVHGECLQISGRSAEAVPHYEDAIAMQRRLFGPDHPLLPDLLGNLAVAHQDLGRHDDARRCCEEACAIIERLRERSRVSTDLRQAAFDRFKRVEVFERLQMLYLRAKMPAAAWDAAERSRGRSLLDLMEQQRFDVIEAALVNARRRGDASTAERLPKLRHDLAAVDLELDRALHDLTLLDDAPADDRHERREAVLARFRDSSQRRRQLLDECARRTGDVSPVGRTRSAVDVKGLLRDGEILLQYTCTPSAGLLYVLTSTGDVEALELPHAHATLTAAMASVRAEATGSVTPASARGRDPAASTVDGRAVASATLFASLIPEPLWPRLRNARRVFIAAHRALHAIPFEALVVGHRAGEPVRWIDEGPPISYVPTASMLCWLRQRGKDASDDATSLDLLAVGDPSVLEATPAVPQAGAFVLAAEDGGEGARIGLLPGDVIVSYDGQPVADDKALRDLIDQTHAAVEDGKRQGAPVFLRVWRRGETTDLAAAPDRLDIEVATGSAGSVAEARLDGEERIRRVMRAGEIERIRRLPPLTGARVETEAIARVFADRQASLHSLLGVDATEPAVFDLAARAKYVHFACHGIAEECAGQSLSMLVLSQAPNVMPGDDGLLKLSDLFGPWRGRLSSCRLVVLSACRTNVGPTLRDEAPQALPIGFLFAGASAVVSSLWAVDDTSTKDLMTDFYGRLLAGETDRLKAFTDAKKALRQKHPDPFRWAPFLFMGSPD